MMAEKLLASKVGLVSEMLGSHPEVKIFGRISNLIEKRCKELVSQGMELGKGD